LKKIEEEESYPLVLFLTYSNVRGFYISVVWLFEFTKKLCPLSDVKLFQNYRTVQFFETNQNQRTDGPAYFQKIK
jgi:hypothetical protein